MRTHIMAAVVGLTLAGCGGPENRVLIPDGVGAWLLMEDSLLQQAGDVTVASRNAKGETTIVHGTYTTSRAGVAMRRIEVKADCGVMYFQQLAGHLMYKDPDRESRAAGARSCGFGDRLQYSGWKLGTLNGA
jgi:hypothetical protein